MPFLSDANPSLIEKLLDALKITGGVKTASSIIIALGAILICGFLMTRLTKLLKLPNVTAYIITGIIIGPFVINLIPQDFIKGTDFLGDIALAFIAFSAGEYFKINDLKKGGGKVAIITLFECLITFAVVFSICKFALGLPLTSSLVLGALGTATAPARTLMTIRQTRAKGHYVNTLLEVIALDNVFTLILFSVSVSICVAFESGASLSFEQIGLPIIYNIICVAIGLVFGFVLKFLISSKRTTDNRLIIVVAVLLLFCGVCSLFKQSPLLGCMAIGMVYTNTAKDEEKLFAQVNYFIPPIMLIFFVRSGMNLNFSSFISGSAITAVPLIVVILVFCVSRLAGKYGGTFVGSLATRMPPKTRNYLGFGLFPQASVAIGLATMGARIFTSAGLENEASAFTTIVIAASVICELIGPLCAKLGLYLSGSYGKESIDDLAPESRVKEEVINDEGSSKEIDLLAAQIKHISKEIKPLEPDEAAEQAFTEAAEEYQEETTVSRNYRRFINRK